MLLTLIIIVRDKELFPVQEAVIQWANPIYGLLRPCPGSVQIQRTS